ncbi:MAG: hypothetical protein A2145_02600 [candidate division Zixibacteria bacterium RBG_16_40_9]|nr:MAG: hypothetical protein A2145_02600 [candidate division Zixibacteria bacterium RBG_16_40_9]
MMTQKLNNVSPRLGLDIDIRHKACFYLSLERSWNSGKDWVKKMLKKHKNNNFNHDYKKPQKTYWHIYGLQTLSSDKFVKVVNKILKRDYILIK